MSTSLAVKYRPSTFDDVTEQESVKIILQNQLTTGEWKHAYLFCGGAGTGKTTCARIFANELNKHQGNPIELDAASNNSIEDVREIGRQAKSKSLDSEYKVFIIDECHALSNSAWQAMLKLIEEPPLKSVFIFCTTDPQKIPKTILSRVQRYDFNRISQQGIINRLMLIASEEKEIDDSINWYGEALEYIAKIADGGMRDAVMLLDKCLALSTEVTLDNVVKALGTTDYDTMFKLTDKLIFDQVSEAIVIVETIYDSGKDLKLFVKQYVQFLLDLAKYGIGCDWKYLKIPRLSEYEDWLNECDSNIWECVEDWLSIFINLNSDIKWSTSVKYDIEAAILMGCDKGQ